MNTDKPGAKRRAQGKLRLDAYTSDLFLCYYFRGVLKAWKVLTELLRKNKVT